VGLGTVGLYPLSSPQHVETFSLKLGPCLIVEGAVGATLYMAKNINYTNKEQYNHSLSFSAGKLLYCMVSDKYSTLYFHFNLAGTNDV
jgi:hypothetical protein